MNRVECHSYHSMADTLNSYIRTIEVRPQESHWHTAIRMNLSVCSWVHFLLSTVDYEENSRRRTIHGR